VLGVVATVVALPIDSSIPAVAAVTVAASATLDDASCDSCAAPAADAAHAWASSPHAEMVDVPEK